MESDFWSKVKVLDNGCWEWQGARDQDGYGRCRGLRAHQVAYIQTYGAIPDGKELHHTCSYRTCVNPGHLEAITHADHMRKTPGTYGYKWATKMHCLKGHALTEDNLIPSDLKAGRRRCRTCDIERQRLYRRAHPEKAAEACRRWKAKQVASI